MLAQVVPPRNIEAFLAIELTKLQSLINVDERLNLQEHQIPVISQHLLTNFKNENLADFTICFRNGAMGKYGQIFRLDGAVICDWMNKYLEEKYQVIENNLMKEKENPYENYAHLHKGSTIDWFEKWKESIGFTEKSPDNKTVNELERFKLGYKPPTRNDLLKRELHKQWIHENYGVDGKPLKGYVSESEWLNKNGYFHIEGILIKADSEEQAQEEYLKTQL